MTKRRKRFITVPCDSMLYETEDDDQAALRAGQWFTVKRRLSKNDYALVMRYAIAAEGEDHQALMDSSDEIIDLLGRKIVDWNLTDLEADLLDNGEEVLLPSPSVEVLAELDFIDDFLELFILYMDVIFPEKK